MLVDPDSKDYKGLVSTVGGAAKPAGEIELDPYKSGDNTEVSFFEPSNNAPC